MTLFRRISLSLHALIEMVVGLSLIAASMLLTLGGMGTILTFAAGVLLAGIGFGAVDGLSLATHQSLDRLLTVTLAIASATVALFGEPLGAVLLLAGAAGMLALTAVTRWTRAPLGGT